MKLHRNAKSTPSSRLALVRRILFEGHSYAEAAAGFGVSTPGRCLGAQLR